MLALMGRDQGRPLTAEYLAEQLAAVLGQGGVQELVLLRGLDHTTSERTGGTG